MQSNICNEPFIIRPEVQLLKEHPHLQQESNALMRKYRFRELVTEADLQTIGQHLWQVLNIDHDFNVAREQAGSAILSILIESKQPDIQQLPWETLYHPDIGFLGRSENTTLSRRISQNTLTASSLERGPLRVLLFTSIPDDLDAETARLNVENEQAQVQEALLPWIAQGIVQLEMPDDGRFLTLKQQLQRVQPHLLFLSGHGKFHHQPHTDEAPYATFLFESEEGHSEPISEENIAKAFAGLGVRCVVLSACESSKSASDALNRGLTQCLSQEGIPYVIGMREFVLDQAGVLFARSFCASIARQEPVEVALQQARQAITTPLKEHLWWDSVLDGSRELSLGQWCLPMLISQETHRPLIDWKFTPQITEQKLNNTSINDISLPPKFLGRRSELRQLKSRLYQKKLRQLLISGPGGQGKTALAGKLAKDCGSRGYEILAWSARPGNVWEDFLFELEMHLSQESSERYNKMFPKTKDETSKAKLLLHLLLLQSQNRIVLFLDNLESVQDEHTQKLNDPRIESWIQAAQSLLDEGLILLLTSRWQIPGWPETDHWSLAHASYGDFLQMARQHQLPFSFFREPNRLSRIYQTLHGNGRGLEFFIAAMQSMDEQEEAGFLQALAQAEAEIQTDMALEKVIGHLSDHERNLLERLPAYQTPVPWEGVMKLGLEMKQPVDSLLNRLIALSLVEKYYDWYWQTHQYQCSPLVAAWLRDHGNTQPNRDLLNTAAHYQHYLFRWERQTMSQALAVHQAWKLAEATETAHQFAMDTIVGPLTLRGRYQTLLKDWLPAICQSKNKQVQADGLGQTGKQYLHLGDYDRALDYLKQSLSIQQEIGDKSGEGATLNNVSTICLARGDYDWALDYLKQSLSIQQEIGDKSSIGTTLNNISQVFLARGNHEVALDYLKQSLSIQQEVGNKAGAGSTLHNISQIFETRGDYDWALDYLKQSLSIRQEIGDKSGEGTTLNSISQIFKVRGDYDRALDYQLQSLSIQREIGNKSGEGATLHNVSQIFKARGNYETALDYLQQSLSIRQEIGDKSGEGATLTSISTIFLARGGYDWALDYLKRSLSIQQEIGDKSGEGTTLNNISQVFQAREDHETALHYLQQSLSIRQEIGDKLGESAVLNNISTVFQAREDYETALYYLQQALSIQREIGNKSGEGTTLNNISAIFQARGDYDMSLYYLKQSLSIRQEIGDAAGLCTTLFNIGHIHFQNEERPQALECWLDSYELAKSLNLKQGLDALEHLAGQLYLRGGLQGWERLSRRRHKKSRNDAN